MDFLVGRVFRAEDPSVRGARRRRDEEELIDLRRLKVLGRIHGSDEGRRFAIVDLGANGFAEEGLVVQSLADAGCVGFGFEGADDAAEGRERGEGV